MADSRTLWSSPSLPDAVTWSTTGDSGGTYQTIGRVRNSGCSGSATSYSVMSFQIGDCWAALIHEWGTPLAWAWATTCGSFGSSRISRWARYRSRSSSWDAAQVTRSAS